MTRALPGAVSVVGDPPPGAGDEVPSAVAQTARFLLDHDVWFRLSRNAEARSCRDAARKRYRLGHVGIPLQDEMKSFFGRVGVGDERRYVAAHCRGDRLLDMQRLARALDVDDPPVRLEADELSALQMEYGLVNPFRRWARFDLDGLMLTAPVLQVFDSDLVVAQGSPGTVMTNAGDLTWAVELRPDDLAGHLDHALVADITVEGHYDPPRYGHGSAVGIGIITGNSPESGIALWQAVNATVRRSLGSDFHGDVSMPHVVVDSLPEMGLSMELDARTDEVREVLEASVDRLCEAGAGLIAVACNTSQYFMPVLRSRAATHGADVVSMPEVIARWLTSRGVDEVGLVGIPFVSDFSGPWSAYREPLAGVHVETPPARAMERLTDLAYRVKIEGPNEAGLNQLRDILRQSVESDHVLLALTELSVLLAHQRKQPRSAKVIIDPLTLYGEAVASAWLGRPFPTVEATMVVHLTSYSDIGQRPLNEDTLLLGDVVSDPHMDWPDHRQLAVDRPVVVAVADGLGEHRDGAKASRFVARSLLASSERCTGSYEIADTLVHLDVALVELGHTTGMASDRRRPPASTVAGLAIGPLETFAFGVGDSRVYQLWPGPVHQVTGDRTTARSQRMAEALGTGDVGTGDIEHVSSALDDVPDTIFLVCTDGLDLGDDDLGAMEEEVAALGDDIDDPGSAGTRLLERFVDRCRAQWDDEREADNLSAIVVHVVPRKET